jgi:hypothetical protein
LNVDEIVASDRAQASDRRAGLRMNEREAAIAPSTATGPASNLKFSMSRMMSSSFKLIVRW